MEVILLDKVRNLGDIGAKVSVKPGYARNYLVPYGKAVVANEDSLAKFAEIREELEKNAASALQAAKDRSAKFENASIVIPVKATEDGKLFGSVSASVVRQAFKEAGFEIGKNEKA